MRLDGEMYGLTVLTSEMSRPRAARSVASNTSISCCLNLVNASSLWKGQQQVYRSRSSIMTMVNAIGREGWRGRLWREGGR